MDSFVERIIICPINKMIMLKPVLADDKFYYEKDAITKWLKNNSNSPMTGKVIKSKKVVHSKRMKQLIMEYLKLHPEKKEEQYSIATDHKSNIEEIDTILKKEHYNKLLRFNNFSIELFIKNNLNILEKMLKKAPVDIQKYIIDNCTDLEFVNTDNETLVQLVCKLSKPDIIKYLLDKNVNLMQKTKHTKKTPLHYLCANPNITEEILKYIVDKKVKLDCKDNNNKQPIHYLTNNRAVTIEMIKIFIDNKIDLNCKDKDDRRPIHNLCTNTKFDIIKFVADNGAHLEIDDNFRPIHLICESSACTIEILKYFVEEKKVNLECKDADGFKPIHHICGNSDATTEMVKYMLDQPIDLESETEEGERPIHILYRRKNLVLLKYIMDKGVNVENVIFDSEDETDDDDDEMSDDCVSDEDT